MRRSPRSPPRRPRSWSWSGRRVGSRTTRSPTRAHGFVTVTLAPRILRAETAAVTAVALCQHRWGDLSGRVLSST